MLLSQLSFQFIMESSHTRAAQKVVVLVKASSQSAVPWSSTNRGVVRYNIPAQQGFRSHSWSKDYLKDQLGDKSKVFQKPPLKENTKPVEFKLHTQQRAVKRAMFNYSVATKLYFMEQQKKLEERLQKLIEEEEVRMLRKEMIPRAQLMPFFDRPFYPQRSNRPLTVPREPCFHNLSSKCWSCISCGGLYDFHQQCPAMKPIK
ncbi:hypothetical protein CK203_019643 [Vitis vinifera]|uniref:TPX2 C-terminal domain-containing protein n=1 Tax=Vitis vinifera TaxID=29760 RepID=A0A438JQW1_VITVI|nr:hypothetical protein CK203_019643 [Vitis vinifera]